MSCWEIQKIESSRREIENPLYHKNDIEFAEILNHGIINHLVILLQSCLAYLFSSLLVNWSLLLVDMSIGQSACHLINSTNFSILLSGGFVASLPAGTSVVPSSLSSPVINSHAYEWKCLRFWYFIGSDDVHDWYTASLMVNVRTITSNQTMLLFFAEEVTDKAQYIQIPLPSNYTNAQVFTDLTRL